MSKMGMGRVHVTMGMGMATFSCVPKFPSVESMRMQSNKMSSRHISFFVNNIILSPQVNILCSSISGVFVYEACAFIKKL